MKKVLKKVVKKEQTGVFTPKSEAKIRKILGLKKDDELVVLATYGKKTGGIMQGDSEILMNMMMKASEKIMEDVLGDIGKNLSPKKAKVTITKGKVKSKK